MTNQHVFLRSAFINKQKPKFSVVFVDADNTSDALKNSLLTMEFQDMKDLHRALARRKVNQINPGNRIDKLKYQYGVRNHHLEVEIPTDKLQTPFNIAVLTFELFNSIHILDIKDVNETEVMEKDGTLFHYHI